MLFSRPQSTRCTWRFFRNLATLVAYFQNKLSPARKKTMLNSSKDKFALQSFPLSTKRKVSILLNFPFFQRWILNLEQRETLALVKKFDIGLSFDDGVHRELNRHVTNTVNNKFHLQSMPGRALHPPLWNAFTQGFWPSKQQLFFWKVSLNSCLIWLDQPYTGCAAGSSRAEKPFNKILSTPSQRVSLGIVVTLAEGPEFEFLYV